MDSEAMKILDALFKFTFIFGFWALFIGAIFYVATNSDIVKLIFGAV